VAEFRQTSFAGGEFAPTLWSRHELERYGTGLRTARNFRPTEHGALENRAGLALCEETKGSARARFIRFVYSDDQAYQLVFTDQSVRFIYRGAYVESAPGVPLELVTPYLEADLARLKFSQSGDVVTITRRGYAPRELVRSSHTSWALNLVDFTAEPAWFPMAPAVVSSSLTNDDATHPLKSWKWQVTTVYRDALGRTYESAPADVDYQRSVAYPVWVAGRWYVVGDIVYYLDRPYTATADHSSSGVFGTPVYLTGLWTAGAVGPNATEFKVAPVDVVLYPDRPITVTWTGEGVDGSTFDTWDELIAYTIGDLVTDGVGFYVALLDSTDKAPSSNPTYWDRLDFGLRTIEVVARRIYRGRDGVFGLVGDVGADAVEFTDEGQVPDFSVAPPASTDPFAVHAVDGSVASHDYPDVVTYFGGRRYFAGLGRIQGSCVNDYAKFDTSPVVRADEAVDFTLASRGFEEIRSIVDLDFLVVLTASSEWGVRGASGGESEAISPTSILAKRGSELGSSWLDALVVDDAVLHVQAKGGRVRELSPDGARFKGADLSIYARHLFKGRTVVDWCYQEDPESTVWLVLDDGTFLSFTYNRAQQVWAWARHDTDGLVEACSCIPEGTEDALYLVVARTVGGVTRRFIERMSTRLVLDVREGVFLDSSLSYDGRNTTAKTMTVTGGSAWEPDELVTVTASASTFAASNVGDVVVINPDGDGSEELGSPVPLVITAYTSPTVVTARLDAPLPAAYRAAATTSWAIAVDAYDGLDHLEGREVYALADGIPAGPFTVTGGAVTLDDPAAVVHIGLPYDQEVETLDFLGPPKTQWKAVEKVMLEVEASRGELQVGESLDSLYTWRNRRVDHGYGVVPLETLDAEVRVSSKWQRAGRVALRNSEPTPVTILAVTREVALGGK
jgi:hypothetical protein